MLQPINEKAAKVLVITCAAVAREISQIKQLGGWLNLDLQAITADLHATPAKIPQAVADRIDQAGPGYDHIFVGYGDCGTSGELDRVLNERGASRLPGAHCYEFLAGESTYSRLQDEEPGTFYLTDFLARHFDRLVMVTLGLDRYPELVSTYFANYTRLVYLAQTESAELTEMANAAAQRLGLRFERLFTGYDAITPTFDAGLKEAICHS